MSDSDDVLDIYRGTPLRFLGYANEIGEAFRSIIGNRMVTATYGISIAYVLSDTVSKTRQELAQQKTRNLKKVLFVATDTLLWQMFASVIIPGIAINRICSFFNNRLNKLPSPVRKWTVAGIGIMAIPIIVAPIDNFVDDVLDVTFRKFAPKN
ncbi:hypothetical protein FQA39_LY10917 [Lamprigera yunnana]|nr:hypothetical protein FQA39_LY10917 [Lamprigera yunnana]